MIPHAAAEGKPPPGFSPSQTSVQSTTDQLYIGTQVLRELNGIERDVMGGVPQPREVTYAYCPDTTLPFEDFIHAAVDVVRVCREVGEIYEWQSGVFHLVRMLRAHPESQKWKPGVLLRAMIKARIDWIPDDDHDPDEAAAEFVRHWDKIRFLPGMSPLESAWQRAQESPLSIPQTIAENRPEKYGRFISLVGWLCVTLGKTDVALPCKEIGETMGGLTKMTISTYRGFGLEDGFLTAVAEHRLPGKGKKGAATVFRFAVDLFPSIVKAMGATG